MTALGGASWADSVEEEVEAGTHSVLVKPTLSATEFPSLGDALKAPQQGKGKKNKKGITLSLGEFTGVAPTAANRIGAKLSDQEVLRTLPTSSRGKVEGEDAGGPLGGGFG
ncbi:plant specific eukaryotic initiation factor 4B, partial [Haematococcus lacustris]